MRTRRKGRRKRTLTLYVETETLGYKVELSPEQYPLYLPTPTFPPPGIVEGRAPKPDIDTTMDAIHVAGPTFLEASKQFPDAQFIGGRATFTPAHFAQSLAKMALCASVYTVGIHAVRTSPLRDLILGRDLNLGYWIGCWTGPSMTATHGLHDIRITASADGLCLHAFIRLFAQFGAPEYHIVVGAVPDECAQSADWPFRPESEPAPAIELQSS